MTQNNISRRNTITKFVLSIDFFRYGEYIFIKYISTDSILIKCGPGSSVCIATGYGLDGPGYVITRNV
jgi:hypothetical protein